MAPLTELASTDRGGDTGAAWIGRTLLLWLLINASTLTVGLTSNELDVLTSALQSVDRTWLPNDWYLNLHVGYRRLFNWIAGSLVSELGFLPGAYVGRALVTLVLAAAFSALFAALRLRLWLALLVPALFLGSQSLIAGEWMVGGFDTKTIAYAFVFLALAAFLTRRYALGFAAAGAALSFHVLVGLYALVCLAAATVASSAWRVEWRTWLRHAWPLPLTGALGLIESAGPLLGEAGHEAARAWRVYVYFRNPHHLLPSVWPGHQWMVQLMLATSLFLATWLIARSQALRFLAAYALAGVALFAVGLGLYATGNTMLLRFYVFRFPDVMVPFLSLLLLAGIVNQFMEGRLGLPGVTAERALRLRAVATRSAPILAAAVLLLALLHAVRTIAAGTPDNSRAAAAAPALAWIAAHTPTQAVFLVDPTMPTFYTTARRAMFVSFKHVPQTPAAILEWYRRITLANNGEPQQAGFAAQDEISSNFQRLAADQVLALARSYDLAYCLRRTQYPLPLPIVYADRAFTLYQLGAVRLSTGIAPTAAPGPAR